MSSPTDPSAVVVDRLIAPAPGSPTTGTTPVPDQVEPDAELDFQPDTETEPVAAAPSRWRRAGQLLAGQPGVALLALVVGCGAWWFSDRHGLPLLYADARSHLTISRRLLDGPNHSLVQLGTVWLPLPHVLVAPFTLVAAWWRSGLAVMPVNLVCLVIEAIALFQVVLRAGRSRVGAWLAVVLLLSNPGWLYLHTTALGEPVLFAAMLATVAGLSGWVRAEKAYSGGELALFCGVPAAAAVLSRYDGWAMALAAGVFVVVVAQMRWGQWRYSWHCLRSFAVPSVVAALWWFWFNFRNWGDPLEFQRGKYSAQAQQDLLAKAGQLPDKGQLGRAVHTYTTATLDGAGRWLVPAAVLGAIVWLVAGRLRPRALAPWLLVAVPVGFYVLSLYTGQIVIRLYNTGTESMFNLRYGLQVLPGLVAMCGLGVAVLARAGRRGPVLAGAASVVLVLGVTATWWPDWRSVPVIAEGLQQQKLGEAVWAGSEHLQARLGGRADDGGLVMVDDSVNPVLPVIGADLDRVSAPFSGPRWTATRRDPAKAEWLFVDTANGGDAVARALHAHPGAAARFHEVFRDGSVRVLHRDAR